MSRYVMVTGALGFIGRTVTRDLLERGDYVYAVDRLDYAADPDCATAFERFKNFHLRSVDVRTLERLPDVDAVIHCAASTHVDNSLAEGEAFVANNVGTTARLLELIRAKSQHGAPHLVHVSTDEVYGPAQPNTAFDESAPLNPTSPYAASKAAADLLVQAWSKTYDVPYGILRPTNCFGAFQYPEKLIPKTIRNLVLGRAMTIHGDGQQTRQWLHVSEAARALVHAADKQLRGIFNVGGTVEANVVDVVARIRAEFGEKTLAQKFGYTRAGCDVRYCINDAKLRATGWRPQKNLWEQLPHIVALDRARFRF